MLPLGRRQSPGCDECHSLHSDRREPLGKPQCVRDSAAMTPAPPPRLHVLLARDSSRAVVFRRGPSNAVAVILWDRATDRVELGQWLRGRIYVRRADLSPDGQHMIYFAMNGRWQTETGGSWTAISRPPWLRALVLWGKGDGWCGGGLWTGNRRYWLNDGPPHRLLRDHRTLVRAPVDAVRPGPGGECLRTYLPRLLRDGWVLLSSGRERVAFVRDLPGGWRLHKLFHAEVPARPGRGVYWEEHALERRDGEVLVRPEWEWAERDESDIVYAEGGRLWRQRVPNGTQLDRPRLVADFRGMRFEPIAAPY